MNSDLIMGHLNQVPPTPTPGVSPVPVPGSGAPAAPGTVPAPPATPAGKPCHHANLVSFY